MLHCHYTQRWVDNSKDAWYNVRVDSNLISSRRVVQADGIGGIVCRASIGKGIVQCRGRVCGNYHQRQLVKATHRDEARGSHFPQSPKHLHSGLAFSPDQGVHRRTICQSRELCAFEIAATMAGPSTPLSPSRLTTVAFSLVRWLLVVNDPQNKLRQAHMSRDVYKSGRNKLCSSVLRSAAMAPDQNVREYSCSAEPCSASWEGLDTTSSLPIAAPIVSSKLVCWSKYPTTRDCKG